VTRPELEYGFDDDQRPVAAVAPAVYDEHQDETVLGAADARRLRQEVLCRTLALLVDGAPDAATIGKRTAALAFMLRLPGAPRTFRQLGKLMGVSGCSAHRRLTKLKHQLRTLTDDDDGRG